MYTIEEAEYVYNNGLHEGNEMYRDIILLALYMRDYLGYKPSEMKNKIYEYIHNNDLENFNRIEYFRIVNKAILIASNKKNILHKYEKIVVPYEDIKFINEQDALDDKEKMMLFTFIWKLRRTILNCQEMGIDKQTRTVSTDGKKWDEIAKVSCVKLSSDSYIKHYKKLIELDLIKDINGMFFVINFHLGDGDGIEVVNEKEVGMYYLVAVKKARHCIKCDKMFIRRGKTHVMCKSCSKESEREKARERKIRFRSKNAEKSEKDNDGTAHE